MVMKKLVVATLFVAACGDDAAKNPDAGVDSATAVDAAVDAPVSSWTKPAAHSFALSTAGHDKIMSVAAGPSGSFYAAGYVAADHVAGTTQNIVVMKLLPTGLPDATFGSNGVLNTQVAFKGGNDEIDIVVAADGSAIVSATVAAATTNTADNGDTDIALIKITAAGALDTTWGGGDGVVVHSFNTSLAATNRDVARGLAVRSNGQIFVHGAQRGEGLVTGGSTDRVDTDFVIAKFTAAGDLDTTWGDSDGGSGKTGKHVQDIYYLGKHSNATARGIHVLDGGAVIAAGYAGSGIIGPAEPTPPPQPVLIRLTPDGAMDPNFGSAGTPGLFHEVVLGWQAEAYGFARHGDKLVTGGYGRETKTPNVNNYISIRVDATTGVRDFTFGTGGKAYFDPTPANSEAGSNCRGAFALPNGKTLLVGSTSRATGGAETQDAVFAVLDADGQLDTKYGTGIATYALGSDGADQFWAGAENGGKVLIAGWKQTVGDASATNNDDAYGVLLTLE